MSNTVDQTMALTPPSQMNVSERLGATIAGFGILMMYVFLMSAWNFSNNLGWIFAFAPIAAAGMLLTSNKEKYKGLAAFLAGSGLFGLLFHLMKPAFMNEPNWIMFALVYLLPFGGAVVYFTGTFGKGPAGIKNNGITHSEATRKGGLIAWMMTIVFTGFYVLLYWYPQNLYGLVAAADPVAHALTGKHTVENGAVTSQWFAYGMIYTFLVLSMGYRYILKYRHNNYQVLRTISVSFFQLVVAFLLPAFLEKLHNPGEDGIYYHYLSYFWPLDYDALWPSFIDNWNANNFGKFTVAWAIVMSLVAVPVLTYFFGKRWYCSWVCGCGGLAETAGDPFRHLSDKSLKAWRFERISIHSVLVLIFLTTVLLLVDAYVVGFMSETFHNYLTKGYGFIVASVFAGVVGTGFYPLLGSRVWCRFGCPQAAILGILQKYFSRFRITTNGAQCISCGNCSTYCEMGIDVKWYAQRGQNIVRASCVGCGVCSAVCPRGVLNLENGPLEGRINDLNPISISADEVKVNS